MLNVLTAFGQAACIGRTTVAALSDNCLDKSKECKEDKQKSLTHDDEGEVECR